MPSVGAIPPTVGVEHRDGEGGDGRAISGTLGGSACKAKGDDDPGDPPHLQSSGEAGGMTDQVIGHRVIANAASDYDQHADGVVQPWTGRRCQRTPMMLRLKLSIFRLIPARRFTSRDRRRPATKYGARREERRHPTTSPLREVITHYSPFTCLRLRHFIGNRHFMHIFLRGPVPSAPKILRTTPPLHRQQRFPEDRARCPRSRKEGQSVAVNFLSRENNARVMKRAPNTGSTS